MIERLEEKKERNKECKKVRRKEWKNERRDEGNKERQPHSHPLKKTRNISKKMNVKLTCPIQFHRSLLMSQLILGDTEVQKEKRKERRKKERKIE